MQTIQCKIHKKEFQLPTTEEEFLSGSLHDDVEALYEHHERYPKCRFLEVRN
jgi:hypothetical protein